MHDDLQLLAAQDEALVCLLIACVRARAAHAAKLGFFAALRGLGRRRAPGPADLLRAAAPCPVMT
jgi:hypothetical protein